MISPSLFLFVTGVLVKRTVLAAPKSPGSADQESLGYDPTTYLDFDDDLDPLWIPSWNASLIKRQTHIPGRDSNIFPEPPGDEGFWYDRSESQDIPELQVNSDPRDDDPTARGFLTSIEGDLNPPSNEHPFWAGISFPGTAQIQYSNSDQGNYVLMYTLFGTFQTNWPTNGEGGQPPLNREVRRDRQGDLGEIGTNLHAYLRDRMRIAERSGWNSRFYTGLLVFSRGNFGIYFAVYRTNADGTPPSRIDQAREWLRERISRLRRQQGLTLVSDALNRENGRNPLPHNNRFRQQQYQQGTPSGAASASHGAPAHPSASHEAPVHPPPSQRPPNRPPPARNYTPEGVPRVPEPAPAPAAEETFKALEEVKPGEKKSVDLQIPPNRQTLWDVVPSFLHEHRVAVTLFILATFVVTFLK